MNDTSKLKVHTKFVIYVTRIRVRLTAYNGVRYCIHLIRLPVHSKPVHIVLQYNILRVLFDRL